MFKSFTRTAFLLTMASASQRRPRKNRIKVSVPEAKYITWKELYTLYFQDEVDAAESLFSADIVQIEDNSLPQDATEEEKELMKRNRFEHVGGCGMTRDYFPLYDLVPSTTSLYKFVQVYEVQSSSNECQEGSHEKLFHHDDACDRIIRVYHNGFEYEAPMTRVMFLNPAVNSAPYPKFVGTLVKQQRKTQLADGFYKRATPKSKMKRATPKKLPLPDYNPEVKNPFESLSFTFLPERYDIDSDLSDLSSSGELSERFPHTREPTATEVEGEIGTYDDYDDQRQWLFEQIERGSEIPASLPTPRGEGSQEGSRELIYPRHHPTSYELNTARL